MKLFSFMTKVNQSKLGNFPWDMFKSDTIYFFIKKLLKYFSDFQNPNFRHLSIGHIQIWHFFYSKIWKYFGDFQNRSFSVLWLRWTQAMEMRQNQTFFHEICSNLTSFFIGSKILNYFIDFYNWHLSISLQKWAKTSKVKWN